VRVLRNAVLDDKTPASKGEVIEYWRGETDVEPHGLRREVFMMARVLMDMGRVVLFQYRHGSDDYSYRMEVTK